MEKTTVSKILIVGVTGNLGFEVAKASLHASHPTFGLVRESAYSDPVKCQKLHILGNAGVTLLKGSLQDEDKLLEAVKQVDVVICAISAKQALDQKPLIHAIKRAGCIKALCFSIATFFTAVLMKSELLQRFIPSEFGSDPNKTCVSDLGYNFYSPKSEIRRLVEAECIPYTYIFCNFFITYLLPSLVQPGLKFPPRDKVTIFGDGTMKGVFMKESDIAAFTISTVDDPRTLNKGLYLRPPGNMYSMNELVEIWEDKICKKLQKIYITEEELLRKIKETPFPDNVDMIFIYSAFVKGDQICYDIEASGGVEGTQLYPQLKYTTISEYLDTLL